MQNKIMIALFVIANAGASAQIVKCRDGGGRIQFAERCPAGSAKLQEIDGQAPAAAPEVKTWQQRETEFQIRHSERNGKAKERANAVVASESVQCQRARAMVEAIKEKRAFRAPGGLLSEPKERVYLDDSERELFENDVKKYCPP